VEVGEKRWNSGGGFKRMRKLKWVKRLRKWRRAWRMREVEVGQEDEGNGGGFGGLRKWRWV
jgi:hypothetical protein